MDIILRERLKMYHFSRWLAINYEGVLNTQNGYWYAEQIKYFDEHVYPNILKTAEEHGENDKLYTILK